jgi:hypothetical protein
MAVTLLRRPEGYIITGTEQLFSNVEVTSSFSVFVASGHGLNDGDIIFIKCAYEDYNGFWYVKKVSTIRFQLFKDNANGSPTDYVAAIPRKSGVTLTGSFWKCSSHKWSAVHLPMTYKLRTTLWPTNSADTVRTISTLGDSNGYCAITTSGDIKATGSAAKLEFVKVSGSTDSAMDGVYQIISYSSDTSFTINLAYSSAVDTALTGASIQYYYNNFSLKVKVYAGIPSGHTFATINQTILISERKLIPDSNGELVFSIHELIQKQLQLRNGRLLYTLPNNIDFWTSFYITYAESYDDSDGTTLGTFTSSYTDDSANFIGYAVQSKLPFKEQAFRCNE